MKKRELGDLLQMVENAEANSYDNEFHYAISWLCDALREADRRIAELESREASIRKGEGDG